MKQKTNLLHRSSSVRVTAVALAVSLALAARAGAAEDDPYGVKTWPNEPEWQALTNHLQVCYRAVIERYQAANVSTNGLAWVKPTLVYPYRDYQALAEAIDEITPSYIVQTNAASGSFDAWLATHPATNDNLPRWTPDALHAYCGFESWGNDSTLTSWAVCDRSIQTQVVFAVQALRMTGAGAQPYPASGSHQRTVWEGWGAATYSGMSTVASGLWPYASAESAPLPSGGWQPPTPCTNFIAIQTYCPIYEWPPHSHGETAALSVGWQGLEDAKPWLYRMAVTVNGNVRWPGPLMEPSGSLIGAFVGTVTFSGTSTLPQIDARPRWRELQPPQWSALGTATFARSGFPCASTRFTPTGVHLDWAHYEDTWYDDYSSPTWRAIVTSATDVTPYLRSERISRRIKLAANCALTTRSSSRALYLRGAMPQFPLSEGYPGQWQSEVTSLITGRFTRCWSETSTLSNSFFTAADIAAAPYVGDATVQQKGWSVANGFWVVDWTFPVTPLPEAIDPTVLPPDTDLDGIVNTLAGAMDGLEPFGSAGYLPDWDQPFIRIPLASYPKAEDLLTVHADLTSGRSDGLPYRTLTARYYSRDPYYGEPPETYGDAMPWTLLQLSVDTRIVEECTVDTEQTHRRRVSVLRPHGRLVVFDFPWADGDFGTNGYPVGRDANRTYVLDRLTDTKWRLRFADGVYHEFVKPHEWDDYALLDTIGRADGCSVKAMRRILIARGENLYGGVTERPTFLKENRDKTTSSCVGFGFSGTRLDTLTFSNKAGRVVTTTLVRDATDRITGLSKNGHGSEDASFVIDHGNATITHAWGSEHLDLFQRIGLGATTRLVFTGSGATWQVDHTSDALGRPTLRKMTTGDQTSQETWSWWDTAGRFASGVPRNARVRLHTPVNGNATEHTYDQATGWPLAVTGFWRGLSSEWRWRYVKHAGQDADAANPVERPRTTEWLLDGAVVRRTLTTVFPKHLLQGYELSRYYRQRVVEQRCRTPQEAWGAAGAFVTTNTLCLYSPTGPASGVIGFGLLLSVDAPDTGMAFAHTDLDTTTTWRTGGRVEQTRRSVDGVVTGSVSWIEGMLAASQVAVACDPLGRPQVTVYNDGTSETVADWAFWGPETVYRRDLTTCHIRYDALGRVDLIDEPDLDRVTSIASDPLGLETVTTVTQGGLARVTTERSDLLGRPRYYADSLTTNTWSYEWIYEDAWLATVQRNGLADEGFIIDGEGAVQGQGFAGAQRHYQDLWFVEGNALCKYVLLLDSDDSGGSEWIKYEYDLLGRVRQAQKSGVAQPRTIEYNAAGHPWRLTDESGVVRILNHDEATGLASAGLKRAGPTTALQPGGKDRMMRFDRVIESVGVTRWGYVYPTENVDDAIEWQGTYRSFDGRQAAYCLDGLYIGSVEATPYTGPAACQVDSYLPNGRQTSETYGPRGLTGTVRRDGNGATLSTATVAASADGLGVTINDSAQGQTEVAIDLAGRLLQVDSLAAGGSRVDVRYRPGTDLPKSITGGGTSMTCEYYPNGLPWKVASSGVPYAEYVWDGQGRLKTLTTYRNAQPVVTRWVRHEETGRLLRKEVAGQTVETYGWRANGQIDAISRPDGAPQYAATTFQFPSLGSVALPLQCVSSKTLQFQYGTGGELSGTVDTAPALATETVTSGNDRMGYLATHAVAGGIAIGYTRQLDGGVLIANVQGNGIVPDHHLDYSLDWGDGQADGFTLTSAGPTRALATIRDAASRTISLVSGPISAQYNWSNFRTAAVTIRVAGVPKLVLSNGWNQAMGVRTNIAWHLPPSTLQPPPAVPRLPSFALRRGPGTNRISRIEREDGSAREAIYDNAGQLIAWRHKLPDGSTDPTRSYAYGHDGAGNVLTAGRAGPDGQGRDAFIADVFNFHIVRRWNAVDLVGTARADALVLVDGQPVVRDGARFVFSLPLRIGTPAHLTNVTVIASISDGDDEWYAEESVPLRVPACPEEIVTSLAGATVSDSLAEYLFDARNQLRCVTDTIAASRLRSVYDYYPDGRRARKTVSTWVNNAWQVSRVHQFIYDRWTLVRELIIENGSTRTRDYTWGLDLAGQQSGTWAQDAGGIGGLLAITEVITVNPEPGTVNPEPATTSILLPVCDQVGTIHALVAAVTNGVTLATPAVVAAYEYTPFGELLSADGPYAASCPFGFQSKYRDAETGLWYYGHRFFDSKSGKWLTADPIQEAGGLNMTAFCGNDPVNAVDPLGLYAYDMHFLAIYYTLRRAGMPVDQAWPLAYFSAMPDLDPKYNAMDPEVLGPNFKGDPFARDIYKFLHQLNGLRGEQLESMRHSIRELFRNATDARTQGFLLHALADSYGHFEMDSEVITQGTGTPGLYPGVVFQGGMIGSRMAVEYAGKQTYEGRHGHLFDATAPDVVVLRPQLAVDCLADIYILCGGKSRVDFGGVEAVVRSLPRRGLFTTDKVLQNGAWNRWMHAVNDDGYAPMDPQRQRFDPRRGAFLPNEGSRLSGDEVSDIIRQLRAHLAQQGTSL